MHSVQPSRRQVTSKSIRDRTLACFPIIDFVMVVDRPVSRLATERDVLNSGL